MQEREKSAYQNPASEQHSVEAQVPWPGPHCPLVLVPPVPPPAVVVPLVQVP
jgi:hypothetical protein